MFPFSSDLTSDSVACDQCELVEQNWKCKKKNQPIT